MLDEISSPPVVEPAGIITHYKTMTQKQALVRVLEIAPSTFGSDSNTKTAARAFFVIEWLHDMNWHPEAEAIHERVLTTPRLIDAFRNLEQNEPRAGKIQHEASFLNGIFGWGFQTGEWQATQGTPLVEELWRIITALPD
jgi:hypothetical protein